MSRVLHILGRMERGGAELRTLEVMRALSGRHRCDVCVLSGRAGELDDAVRELGGAVHPIGLGPRFTPRFLGLLRRERYDVVHSHVHYVSGFMLMLARLAGVRGRVAHFRNSTDGGAATVTRRLRNALLRGAMDRFATDILGVAEAALDGAWDLRWRQDPRCRVIYNGIPLARERDSSPRIGGPVLLHIGALRRAKNHHKLLAVFAALRRRVPEVTLQLAGADQGELAALRQQAAALGITDCVHFLGARDDVAALIERADLMIFPSLWEGLPGAVLEAAADGLPVLASDLPVLGEMTKYLPQLAVLPVAAADDVWADNAALLLRTRTAEARVAARRAFADTPFTLPRCVAQFDELWSRYAADA